MPAGVTQGSSPACSSDAGVYFGSHMSSTVGKLCGGDSVSHLPKLALKSFSKMNKKSLPTVGDSHRARGAKAGTSWLNDRVVRRDNQQPT